MIIDRQDFIKYGGELIGKVDFENPTYTKSYWYLRNDIYEGNYIKKDEEVFFIGGFDDIYGREILRNEELPAADRDDRLLTLLQEFRKKQIVNDASGTEMTRHFYEDYPEDVNYREFCLDNAQKESYIQHLMDTYNLPENWAADLQNRIIQEIGRRCDEEIMDIYVMQGIERKLIFTATPPNQEAYEKLIIKIPMGFMKYEDESGEVCIVNRKTGMKYTVDELIHCRNNVLEFRWHERKEKHRNLLTILDGPELFKDKPGKRNAVISDNLGHEMIRR